MSVLTAYYEAFDAADHATMDALLHDAFKFNPHAGGVTFSKAEIMQWLGSEHVQIEGLRILYESASAGVAHGFAHFANGSDSEAVLTYFQLEDGRIRSMETGATPQSEAYKVIGSDEA